MVLEAMHTRALLVGASVSLAVAFAAASPAAAQFQDAQTALVCERRAALETARRNFENLDVTAPLHRVDDAAQQMGTALDQLGDVAEALRPATFAQARQAQTDLQSVLQDIPASSTPQQVQTDIASARERERFAYQSLADSLVCP
jgi:hypothetical protein